MSKVYLRAANSDDTDLLYRWANDPVVRKNSFNTDRILYENHVMWFNRIIEDPNIEGHTLVVDADEDGYTVSVKQSMA